MEQWHAKTAKDTLEQLRTSQEGLTGAEAAKRLVQHGPNRLARKKDKSFAARLLAPACVLHEIGATNASDIQKLCRISAQAAEYRAERMRELEQRGRFYTSPLERQLIRKFESYIDIVKRNR